MSDPRDAAKAAANEAGDDIAKLRELGEGGNVHALWRLRNLEQRKESKRLFIKQHAPTILAGLIDRKRGAMWEDLRQQAIEQAGLLFDEIEAL